MDTRYSMSPVMTGTVVDVAYARWQVRGTLPTYLRHPINSGPLAFWNE